MLGQIPFGQGRCITTRIGAGPSAGLSGCDRDTITGMRVAIIPSHQRVIIRGSRATSVDITCRLYRQSILLAGINRGIHGVRIGIGDRPNELRDFFLVDLPIQRRGHQRIVGRRAVQRNGDL